MSQRQTKTPIHHEVGIPFKVLILGYYSILLRSFLLLAQE